jgi:hypothetical protein
MSRRPPGAIRADATLTTWIGVPTDKSGAIVTDGQSAPPGVDITKPHAARVYDWALGGKDNYAADREYAAKVVAVTPEYPRLAKANRGFLERAVRLLAESGIRQFIDLGTGIPTSPSVHDVARDTDPSARVVYVDNDPIVTIHNDALLATEEGIHSFQADIRQPQEILGHPGLRTLIDFDEPVGVLIVAVLHIIPDADDPAGIVSAFRERMPPGSYLALSQLTSDSDEEAVAQAQAATAGTAIPLAFRPREEIRRFFGGFELVEPGLVGVQEWRPDTLAPATRLTVLGGVGRKL